MVCPGFRHLLGSYQQAFEAVKVVLIDDCFLVSGLVEVCCF